MTPIAVSIIAFFFIFGGAIAGMWLRYVLPGAHLTDNSKDAVRLCAGLIATIAALVLGLLIASAKGSYDQKNTRVKKITADIIMMDNLLAEYGPDARRTRELLREVLEPTIARIWDGSDPMHRIPFEASPQAKAFYASLYGLEPKTEYQKALHNRATAVLDDLSESRLVLYTQAGYSISPPFFAILVFWLAVIFASFSLFIRPEPIVLVAFFICALSATGALFLILEMDRPFIGLMQIRKEPLQAALPALPVLP